MLVLNHQLHVFDLLLVGHLELADLILQLLNNLHILVKIGVSLHFLDVVEKGILLLV